MDMRDGDVAQAHISNGRGRLGIAKLTDERVSEQERGDPVRTRSVQDNDPPLPAGRANGSDASAIRRRTPKTKLLGAKRCAIQA